MSAEIDVNSEGLKTRIAILAAPQLQAKRTGIGEGLTQKAIYEIINEAKIIALTIDSLAYTPPT